MIQIAQINQSLVGKRVKGRFAGIYRTGTVTGLLNDERIGVVVKLDKPLLMTSSDGEEMEDTFYKYVFRKFSEACQVLDIELVN